VRDVNVSTDEQAEFFARRKLAESRRTGWQLTYTVAGHSTRAIGGLGRAVWTPDTVVEVEDDEFGLRDLFYIEAVDFRRPPTTTTLTLMRTGDLVFGSDD
jgi:prophage tail gpP-like protein